MARRYLSGTVLLLAAAGFPSELWVGRARAQAPADRPDATISLPPVEVVGTTPVLGSGIEPDKVPAYLQSLSDLDLRQEGVPDLTGTLQRRFPNVTASDVQGNAFQPTLQFRGFEASPVIGSPQGLAVYQNGVRINEAFGDAVNWDLVPSVAIDRADLVTGAPAFGLNALGGALSLRMKNGFTFQGFDSELYGGSFGRRAGSLQYGAQAGNFATYIAGDVLNENGWRDSSATSLRRLYADLGGRSERAELHLSFSGAANLFGATATTPIELLNQRWANVYTTPQNYRNNLAFVTVSGSYRATDTLSFQSNLYYRVLHQRAIDGNAADFDSCDASVARRTLCLNDERSILYDAAGNPIPRAALRGGVPGTIDRTNVVSTGWGGALQLTSSAPVLERRNHLSVGLSLDRGVTGYRTSSELGIVGSDLYLAGTGITIAEPNGEIAPTHVRATNNYYGLYATDTWDLTGELAVSASGRFNLAEIRLQDQLGTSLNGDRWYSRFNPAAGATYKLSPAFTAYAGYSEANRTPTPSELGCADPARPCLLANFVVSDPPLKQVVSHTYEAGLRGGVAPSDNDRLSWKLGLFRSDLSDDIIIVASPITGRGYFRNAGDTRRQGLDSELAYRTARWQLRAGYSLIDATFQSAMTLSSPNNPAATGGRIAVRSGDRLPAIPTHRVRAGAEYAITPGWRLGADLVFASSQYLRGDEANQNQQIPPYWVVNLHSSYELTENVQLFALVQNLLDRKYATFGTFFDPTQIPLLRLRDPRSLAPAPPLGVFAGVRVRL